MKDVSFFMVMLALGAGINGCGDGSSDWSDNLSTGSASSEVEVDDELGADTKLEPNFENSEWEFVLLAESGSAQKVSERGYIFTLNEVAISTLAFTDRPARQSVGVSTESVFSMWRHMFANDPPNAVIVHHDPLQAERAEFAFEMINPVYDPDAQMLTFEAILLGDAGVTINNLNQISLFIDPTLGQWISIIFNCGATVVNAIGVVIFPEEALLGLAAGYTLGCRCCRAIVAGWNLNYNCAGCL
jgi:hypothetical protein